MRLVELWEIERLNRPGLSYKLDWEEARVGATRPAGIFHTSYSACPNSGPGHLSIVAPQWLHLSNQRVRSRLRAVW